MVFFNDGKKFERTSRETAFTLSIFFLFRPSDGDMGQKPSVLNVQKS